LFRNLGLIVKLKIVKRTVVTLKFMAAISVFDILKSASTVPYTTRSARYAHSTV